MSEHSDGATDVERQLDELQHESQLRRTELREIAAELPEATSRRALVRSMFRSVATAPNKLSVAKRAVMKAFRTPAELVRRTRTG